RDGANLLRPMISTPTPVFHRLANASSTPTVGDWALWKPISWKVRVGRAHSRRRWSAWPNGASRLCPSPVPNPSSETEKFWTRTLDAGPSAPVIARSYADSRGRQGVVGPSLHESRELSRDEGPALHQTEL